MPAPANGTAKALERALGVAAECRRDGRHDRAEFHYREVLGVMADNVEALYGLATVRHSAGAHGEAEELLVRGLAHAPHDARLVAALEEVRASESGGRVEPRRSFSRRAANRLTLPLLEAAVQRPRVWKYRALSSCPRVAGSPIALQPVLFVGPGAIVLGSGVQFGWKRSPLFYAGYCHVEAATPDARIELGDRTEFNNNLMIKSEGAGIAVGRDGLFGPNVEIFDTDFHALAPDRRHDGTARKAPVEIGDNVFVGMSVKILKGVRIGSDSVIGAGAVVTASIPAGVVAAGSPARVVREL